MMQMMTMQEFYNLLVGLLSNQRLQILRLLNTELTEAQWQILRGISEKNHEIAQALGVQVPSMKDLGKQAKEIQTLEHWFNLQANEETTRQETTLSDRMGGDEIRRPS